MARYTGSVCRQCRREGQKLFLKGERCYGDKCAANRRSAPPGQHGQGRRSKASEYGMQLREKQKVKRMYGLLEGQFHRYYEIAVREKGVKGENMLSHLERRLDNVAYKAGFGVSRPHARQLVNHGHFLVNGQKTNIPSYQVSPGDVITVRERSRNVDVFAALRQNGSKPTPKWMEMDGDNLMITINALPEREDIGAPIEEHLIVELYSK